jgi:hypothetical protein
MTGEQLYTLYCREMARLPYAITKGEALPSWEFVNGELAIAWDTVAVQLQLAPKPKARKIGTSKTTALPRRKKKP